MQHTYPYSKILKSEVYTSLVFLLKCRMVFNFVKSSDVPDPDPDFFLNRDPAGPGPGIFFQNKIRPDPDIRQKWQYPAGFGPGR